MAPYTITSTYTKHGMKIDTIDTSNMDFKSMSKAERKKLVQVKALIYENNAISLRNEKMIEGDLQRKKGKITKKIEEMYANDNFTTALDN